MLSRLPSSLGGTSILLTSSSAWAKRASISSPFLIDDVPTPELNVDAHFIALKQKLARMTGLEGEIVRVRDGPQPDFLDLRALLPLARLALFFLLLVPEFPVVDDLAHRGSACGAISTRSNPSSRAISRAFSRV